MPTYTPRRRFELITSSVANLSTDIFILLTFYFGFLNYKHIPWIICFLSILLFCYKYVYTKRDELLPNVLYSEYWKSLTAITITHLCLLVLAEKLFCWYDGKYSLHPSTVFHFVYLYKLLPSTLDLWIVFSDKSLYYEGHDFPGN